MKLWDTASGDKWLCDKCEKHLTDLIQVEEWLPVLKRLDPTLCCSHCGDNEPEIEEQP